MQTSRLALALLALSPASHAYNHRLAELVPQFSHIEGRATYEGGWALSLPGATCPANAPVACSTWAGAVNPTCCPDGQICKGINWPHCCPDNNDCQSIVQNLPVCANSTWTMYSLGDTNYFCCEPGQIGILPITGYTGICGSVGENIAASLIATPASQVGGAAVTTIIGSTGGSGSLTSTTTILSTLAGGGVTTVTSEVAGSATAGTIARGSPAGSTSTGTASSNGTTGTNKGGISIGVIIGVIFGALVLLIVALALVYLIRRQSAPQKAPDPVAYSDAQAPAYGARENKTPSATVTANPQYAEVPGRWERSAELASSRAM